MSIPDACLKKPLPDGTKDPYCDITYDPQLNSLFITGVFTLGIETKAQIPFNSAHNPLNMNPYERQQFLSAYVTKHWVETGFPPNMHPDILSGLMFPEYKLEQFERDLISLPPSEISNLPLPDKTRRKLLIQKVGLPLDPHSLIPGAQVEQLVHLLPNYYRLKNVPNWGMNTHFDTTNMISLPNVQVSQRDLNFEINAKLAKFIASVSNLCQGKWDQVYLYTYPNPWPDSKRVVGLRLALKTLLNRPSLDREDIFTIEAVPGAWPRAIDRLHSTDIAKIDHGSATWNSGFEAWEQMDDQETTFVPGNLNNDQLGLLNLAFAHTRRLVTSSDYRMAIQTLQKLNNSANLTFDICYYISPSGPNISRKAKRP